MILDYQFPNGIFTKSLYDFSGLAEWIKWGVTLICVVGALLSVIGLFLSIVKYMALPDNSFQRREVYMDILKTLVAAIGFVNIKSLYAILLWFINGIDIVGNKGVDVETASNDLFIILSRIATMVAWGASIAAMILFFVHIGAFSASGMSSNSQQRASASKKLIIDAVSMVMFGLVSFFITFFTGA